MKKIEFAKIFAAGFRGISRLVIEFPTEQKSFIKNIRFSLAHTAKKEYPDKNISDLAHMTGLLRSQVDDALEQDCPMPVMDKESLIMTDLWNAKNKYNLVPFDDDTDKSAKAIVSAQLKGKYSVTTVIDNLIASGSVERDGDNLLILSNAYSSNKGEMRILNLLGLVINRIIGTIIYNKNAKAQDPRMYQRSYKSTRVPPRNQDPMHEELHAVLQDLCMPAVRKVIEKYEVDVPEDTYPELGASMFEFNENRKVTQVKKK